MKRLEAGKYEVDCNGTLVTIWQRTERSFNPVTGRNRDLRFWGYSVGDYDADGFSTKNEAWISAYRYCERERIERELETAREARRDARRGAGDGKGKR